MFLRATTIARKEAQIEQLQNNWYANNLTLKGLQSSVSQMKHDLIVKEAKTEKKGELDPVFLKKQWTGLASALGKLNRGRA